MRARLWASGSGLSPLLARWCRARNELNRSRGLSGTKYRDHVGQRDGLELTRQEIANLEHAEFFSEQDRQLGVHVLRQRRARDTCAASAASAAASAPAPAATTATSATRCRAPRERGLSARAFDDEVRSVLFFCGLDRVEHRRRVQSLRVKGIDGTQRINQRRGVLVDGGFNRGQVLRRAGSVRIEDPRGSNDALL